MPNTRTTQPCPERPSIIFIDRALGIVCTALISCGRADSVRDAGPAPDLRVSVVVGALTAPDTVPPGWARVRVDEDGAGHIVVLFRISDIATDPDVSGFLAALDTTAATPAPAIALGGPEIGESGEVVVELRPGRYLFACVRRGSDAHRHAISGEAKWFVVSAAPIAVGRENPPRASAEVQLVDFGYLGPEAWPAGPHLLRVENRGRQDHQLRLARLRVGSSLRQWMSADDPGEHATDVAGVARLGAGAVAYLPVELSAGAYVAYCLVADPASGRPHVELGMLRVFQVRD